jgi:hypothetical protein
MDDNVTKDLLVKRGGGGRGRVKQTRGQGEQQKYIYMETS